MTGMTALERVTRPLFTETYNINPNLRPYDDRIVARYVGVTVPTSIRRNSTVRVNHSDWWLSEPEVLGKLKSNSYKVTAYYLPDDEGDAQDVYLYQDDRFIDKVEKVETFSRVMAEQTDEDKARFARQMQKVNQFKEYLRSEEHTSELQSR